MPHFDSRIKDHLVSILKVHPELGSKLDMPLGISNLPEITFNEIKERMVIELHYPRNDECLIIPMYFRALRGLLSKGNLSPEETIDINGHLQFCLEINKQYEDSPVGHFYLLAKKFPKLKRYLDQPDYKKIKPLLTEMEELIPEAYFKLLWKWVEKTDDDEIELYLLDYIKWCEDRNLRTVPQLLSGIRAEIASIPPELPEYTADQMELINDTSKKLIDLRTRLIAVTKELLPLRAKVGWMSLLDTTIDKLSALYQENAEQLQMKREYEDIIGRNSPPPSNSRFFQRHSVRKYISYPLMNQLGLRCTAEVQKYQNDSPIEISIDFRGTKDMADLICDLETGGPGQKTIKKHELELVKQVNSVIHQVAIKHPQQPIRLRLNGFSLGGALAQCFTYTLQRAIALQNNTPEEIIENIKEGLGEQLSDLKIKQGIKQLTKQLSIDEKKFKQLPGLKKLVGITVCAQAAPGVSHEMDKKATLLSYYFKPEFFRMYHLFHKLDTVPRFGDCTLFAGLHGTPQIVFNKLIINTAPLEDVSRRYMLPFPGITAEVMEAHRLAVTKDHSQQTILELTEAKILRERFTFSYFRQAVYQVAFRFAAFCGGFSIIAVRFPRLMSDPASNLARPELLSKEKEASIDRLQERRNKRTLRENISEHSEHAKSTDTDTPSKPGPAN